MPPSSSGSAVAVRLRRLSVLVLAVGLVVTGALSWLSYVINSRNEDRLLRLQTKETGALFQLILPTIQTPLASAAALAANNNGDVAGFQTYMAAYVGTKATFASASLWRIEGSTARLVTSVGSPPALKPGPADAFLAEATTTPLLSVTGPIGAADAAQQRLAVAFTSTAGSPTYAAYAELLLPPQRRVTVAPDSPFSDLGIAVYLGSNVTPDALLETNLDQLPARGRTSAITVPFGANSLTLVTAPSGQLGGTLSEWLWWIVAVIGVVITALTAVMAERLVRQRRRAEHLTDEVRVLLGQQRTIAATLQHALLPKAIPRPRGIDIGVRYIPGVDGVEIGGDWYDIVELDESRFLFAIGDVSGRGVGAGAVMASLHFAKRAFLSEGHSPERILGLLTGLLSLTRDGHFATVICGIADVDGHTISVANAGHLPPLLVDGDHTNFLSTRVGPPIGVSASATYEAVTITMPPQATLVLYTDGLIERPGESLDEGLARLRRATPTTAASVEDLLDTLVRELTNDGYDDDTAILGIRWLS